MISKKHVQVGFTNHEIYQHHEYAIVKCNPPKPTCGTSLMVSNDGKVEPIIHGDNAIIIGIVSDMQPPRTLKSGEVYMEYHPIIL